MHQVPNHSHDPNDCHTHCLHLDRVAKAREESIETGRLKAMVRIFKALGDTTRLRILTALLGDEMCVCDLAAFLELSQSAASHQLRRLRDLDLVKTRRDGPVLYYSLNDDHVAVLVRVCLEHVNH